MRIPKGKKMLVESDVMNIKVILQDALA